MRKILLLNYVLLFVSCSSFTNFENQKKRKIASFSSCDSLVSVVLRHSIMSFEDELREKNIVFAPALDDFYSKFVKFLQKDYEDGYSLNGMAKNIYLKNKGKMFVDYDKLIVAPSMEHLIHLYVHYTSMINHDFNPTILKMTKFAFNNALVSTGMIARDFTALKRYFTVVDEFVKEGIAPYRFPSKINIYDQPIEAGRGQNYYNNLKLIDFNKNSGGFLLNSDVKESDIRNAFLIFFAKNSI